MKPEMTVSGPLMSWMMLARVRHLLLDLLALELAQQLLQLVGVGVDFAFEAAPLHGVGHGGAHGGNVERLVDVIARPQPQRLPHGVRGLESGHHHRLDARVHKLQPLQHFDAGHARHANVQHRHVDPVLLGQFDRRGAVAGQQDIIFILKDDPQ